MVELFHAPLTRVHDMTKPKYLRLLSFLFSFIPNRESSSPSLFISVGDLFTTMSMVHIKQQNQGHYFTPPLHYHSNPINFLKRLCSELFPVNFVMDISAWTQISLNTIQKPRSEKYP